ncbi:IS1 family transposase [Candidatus Bandiella woodruffii]|uniref:IS1 family transposase n=2 Tax=Candidatus Bandiella euplotis TaxID=1664265 RepID=A0ABZ0ULI2_9RICK|nr:IS1 family transposase [Candidatus Bandiella woodruffii]
MLLSLLPYFQFFLPSPSVKFLLQLLHLYLCFFLAYPFFDTSFPLQYLHSIFSIFPFLFFPSLSLYHILFFFPILFKTLPIISRDNCSYYTDDWSVYSEVIPRHQHVVGKQHTLSIESNNSNTRHRIARMTRKTKVVSKSEEVVDLTIKLWLHFEDNNNFLSEQGNFISIFG